MQDAGNQNTTAFAAIEKDVLAVLMTVQARADNIAEPAHPWIVGQHPATGLKFAKVFCGLRLAPLAKRVLRDAEQIGLGAARKSKLSH